MRVKYGEHLLGEHHTREAIQAFANRAGYVIVDELDPR